MSQMPYYGKNRTPGQSTVVETQENEIRWRGVPFYGHTGCVIAGATVDSGNTGKTHILREGLLLGRNESTYELGVWDPTAIDGTEYIYGVLLEAVTMHTDGTDTDRFAGLIQDFGGVRAEQLIIPGNTDRGIAGDSLEFLVRQQMWNRFVFNDSHQFGRPEFAGHTVSASEQSGGITLVVGDSHRRYNNSGGTVTITLPATPYAGVKYQFYAQTPTTDAITISSGSANIVVPGALAAGVSSYTVDGAIVQFEGNGSDWIVTQLSGGGDGLGGVYIPRAAQQALSGAGAVNITSFYTAVTTTGADALTLADGKEGQLKVVKLVVDGGAGTLTPTNLTGGTTITFEDIGDTAELYFTGGSWVPIALYNTADGTSAPALA